MFKAGDHLVICDKCGDEKFRSECRKDGFYTGMIVCGSCYDPKEIIPKVPVDKQAVKDPRPDIDSSSTTTTVKTSASQGATAIELTSVTNIAVLTGIAIVLDNGRTQYTFATGDPTGYSVPINEILEGAAAAGNAAYIMSGSETNTQTTAERLAAL